MPPNNKEAKPEIGSKDDRGQAGPARRIAQFWAKFTLPAKISVFLLIVVLGAVALNLRVGVRYYRALKQENSLKVARKYAEAGKTNDAVLAYLQAVRANPSKLDPWLEFRGFLEKQNMADVVDVIDYTTRLRPENLAYRRDLVDYAMRFGRWETARKAVEQFPEGSRDSFEYHLSAGRVSARNQRMKIAIQHLERAVELNPQDETAQFSLAFVLLTQTDPWLRARGRELLVDLSVEGKLLRHQAYVERVKAELADRNYYAARMLAGELNSLPDAVFQDRLLALEIDYSSKKVESLLQYLDDLQVDNSKNASLVAEWLIGHGEREVLKKWLAKMPEDRISQREILLVRAKLALQDGDFDTAQKLMLKAEIPGIRARAVEIACEAAKASKQVGGSRTETDLLWRNALDAAEKNPLTLQVIEEIAAASGQREAYEKVIWETVKCYPGYVEGWKKLVRMYSASSDVPKLRDAFEGLSRCDPGNLNARNDWLMLDLLLSRDTDTTYAMARELHDEDPSNPHYLSTYAYSLLRQGRTDEAIRLYESLSQPERAVPVRALYYGTALAIAGRSDDALKSLEIAREGRSRFLPQEAYLWTNSMAIARGEKVVGPIDIPQAPSTVKQSDIKAVLDSVRTGDSSSDVGAILKEVRGDSAERPDEVHKVLDGLGREQSGSPDEIRELLKEVGAKQGGQN